MSEKEVDAYVAAFPENVREMLRTLRATIKRAAPGSEEVISYGMPAYKLNGILVYFAAYKNHIGFYPTSSGIRQFKTEFGNYKSSKGAVQFPIDAALPTDLIERIVRFRAEECLMKTKRK